MKGKEELKRAYNKGMRYFNINPKCLETKMYDRFLNDVVKPLDAILEQELTLKDASVFQTRDLFEGYIISVN